jgi:hypothetical protein
MVVNEKEKIAKQKDTVSTTDKYLPIAEVSGDTIILKD